MNRRSVDMNGLRSCIKGSKVNNNTDAEVLFQIFNISATENTTIHDNQEFKECLDSPITHRSERILFGGGVSTLNSF